jgi:hypothetical protein
MTISKVEMAKKLDAWYAATKAVEPIIEKHGLVQHRVGNIVATTATFSPVDQHIDHIVRVADWLLETEEQ